jgi:hypothetical protein
MTMSTHEINTLFGLAGGLIGTNKLEYEGNASLAAALRYAEIPQLRARYIDPAQSEYILPGISYLSHYQAALQQLFKFFINPQSIYV